MPQLLIELFSEEIPARMQAQAARDFERLAREKLAAEGLLPEALKTFAGPRRLTLVAEGLPVAQPERHEERKGPRVGSPDAALDGFLRSTGLTREQLTERDGVYFAHIHKAGRPTPQIVAEMVDGIVRSFPWPKSMTWGTGSLRWVRPLKRILCVFDREIVLFNIDGIESGDVSEGHRFMGDAKPFRARDFDEYQDGLTKHFVVLDPEERKERIMDGARTLCFARNVELVEDEGLLDEVSGLAEWPTPVLGDMDPAFLDLPPEVIRTSMRTHQKYFAVRDPATGFLVPHFLTVSNIEAKDGGKAIAAGNAKVLSARLNDARFFWDEDRKIRLEDRLEKLKGVTFHAKLGTMYERVKRIVDLAGELAPYVRDDGDTREKAMQAARLAKADLVTGMVGEFPELQGLMGGYYADKERLDPEVADAIRHHYRPQGPSDSVPVQGAAATVALADKLDTLVSFFAIDEKPTGSRDPYALRRAALGVIRILLQSRTRLPLSKFASTDLLAFFADRLKVLLREQNLLGGKGANLAEMASIGLPVPPGFTITTEVCTYYYQHEKQYPAELKAQAERPWRGSRSRRPEVRRRGQAAAGLGALRRPRLDAGHDGHRPQPRPQRRYGGGAGHRLRRPALRLGQLPPLHQMYGRRGARGRPPRFRRNHRGRQGSPRASPRTPNSLTARTGSASSPNTRRWSQEVLGQARSRRTRRSSCGARSAPCSAAG
jgi:glycyl-tRNA synthetase beta chain